MKFQNFRLFILYIIFETTGRFSENYASFFIPWQITVDTLDRARTWNLKFSNCQLFCETAMQILPYTRKHCPALPFTTLLCTANSFALLCYTYLAIGTHLIHKLMKYNFIAVFGRYLLSPSATLSFTPRFFWK